MLSRKIFFIPQKKFRINFREHPIVTFRGNKLSFWSKIAYVSFFQIAGFWDTFVSPLFPGIFAYKNTAKTFSPCSKIPWYEGDLCLIRVCDLGFSWFRQMGKLPGILRKYKKIFKNCIGRTKYHQSSTCQLVT